MRYAGGKRADGGEFLGLHQFLVLTLQLRLTHGKLVFHIVELVDQHAHLVLALPFSRGTVRWG